MKICNEPGCTYPVFSGLKCKYHQYRRHMRGGDLHVHKARKPKEPIAKESKRRKVERIYYKDGCLQLEKEMRAQHPEGKLFCFISGYEITGRASWHHLYGRTGDWYLDKDGLVPTINKYHLMVHRMTVEKLEEQPWYSDYLIRLKNKDEALYNKQIGKKEKALPKLNPRPTLFDDEDFLL
jgi:hypothetical protein